MSFTFFYKDELQGKNLSLQKDRSGTMKILFILLIFLMPFGVQAQQSDSQLAYSYYQQKEYDKAAELFLQLYQRSRSSNYLDYHIICLINGKQYDKAEEVLKKFLKTDNNNKDFLINLGYIYQQQGKTKKALEYYEKAVKKLIPHTSDINNLAYRFKNIREYGWAIKTYLQGREILKQPHAFLSELGEAYMLERDYENMLTLFIENLKLKPQDLPNLISKLSYARSYDIVNNIDIVIEQKLTQLFAQPDYLPVFDELAVWYGLQKKNFSDALQHAILLNQKATENKLYIFLNIAREAGRDHNYPVASTAYNKILETGKENNDLYQTARKELLGCQYQELQYQKVTGKEYQPLVEACEKYMQEYGYNSSNVDIAILLADMYAYQLEKTDSADHILARSTKIRRLNYTTLSQLKSKRADLLAFINNPWEATILYTQIEKSNPNNDIGYEAKLKKAWLAYYTGDLLWAKAQFDVLKGSTTKLISNDAIQIAHFIHMNYDTDEDNGELERMARTEYLIYRKKDKEAFMALDSLINESKPGIADYATLVKARVLSNKTRYDEAANLLLRLKEHSGQTYIRAEAVFRLAELRSIQKNTLQAKELYKLLVAEYSGSVYSVEAGRLYREMKE